MKVNLINFGAELSSDIIQSIEKDQNIEVEQIYIKGTSLNLKKHSVAIQVHDLVDNNKVYFFNQDDFIINLPGLPIFVACLISEVHALTGKFPTIVECVKDYETNGAFAKFQYKRLISLERERTVSRSNFKNEKN